MVKKWLLAQQPASDSKISFGARRSPRLCGTRWPCEIVSTMRRAIRRASRRAPRWPALVALFGAGCSAIVPKLDLIECQSHLDCYALASDDPFACWRCDKSMNGGTCVPNGQLEVVQSQKLDAPMEVARTVAFSAAGELFVIAEQDPIPGSRVDASEAAQLGAQFASTTVPQLSEPRVISQLAVASEGEVAWCLALDHHEDSDGHLCLGPCDETSCPQVCESCGRPRHPSLAIRNCRVPNQCDKLWAYLDGNNSVVGAQLTAGEITEHLQLPTDLDPNLAPVALRLQRRDETRFLLVAAQKARVSPWLGLVDTDADNHARLVSLELNSSPAGDVQLLALAAAAADQRDANGQFLLAWIATESHRRRLFVARSAWLGDDRLAPLHTLFVRDLSGAGSVSLAYARYGIDVGGWVVAFRDGAQALALRVERAGTTQPPRTLTIAGPDDFVVVAHPAGAQAPAPFVFVDRSGERIRVLACPRSE